MYAKVIVDISHEKLDKGFDYRIPAHLENEIYPGVLVNIPFGKGNRIIQQVVPGGTIFICSELWSPLPQTF